MGIQRPEDLDVWKTAHQAVLVTYRVTRVFPKDERFVLITQMRKAALSIPANIAEGFGRRGAGDKMRFYNISQGSIEELKYFCRVSVDLGYVKECEELKQLLDSTARMLKRLIQKTPDLPTYS